MDDRPVRRFRPDPGAAAAVGHGWPFTVPAVALHRTRSSEPGRLDLIVERSPGADRWAYFLREETLHGLSSYLEDNPGRNSPAVPGARLVEVGPWGLRPADWS